MSGGKVRVRTTGIDFGGERPERSGRRNTVVCARLCTQGSEGVTLELPEGKSTKGTQGKNQQYTGAGRAEPPALRRGGVEGDPGFLSPFCLHLPDFMSASSLHGVGITVPSLQTGNQIMCKRPGMTC